MSSEIVGKDEQTARSSSSNAAQVLFCNLDTSPRLSRLKKFAILLREAGIADILAKKDMVAVKTSFGEHDNVGYIRPNYLRTVVEEVARLGADPFLTDTNTLYMLSRGRAVSHLKTASRNGFVESVLGAPVIIADGLRGTTMKTVEVNLFHHKEIYVAAEIANADSLISVAHFKGHDLVGFGGSIKNVGMGCAARKGKLAMHSKVLPYIKSDLCENCGRCARWCPGGAIANDEKVAYVVPEKCLGCGECIVSCPTKAVAFGWNESVKNLQEKIVEYAWGILNAKRDRTLFVNFVVEVNPMCDCGAHTGIPIVPDIGILVSRDPLAIDQAAVDLVNASRGFPDSALTSNHAPGDDKFRGVYPHIDWTIQLEYAERLNLGSRQYELVDVFGANASKVAQCQSN